MLLPIACMAWLSEPRLKKAAAAKRQAAVRFMIHPGQLRPSGLAEWCPKNARGKRSASLAKGVLVPTSPAS
jgi:hypothetical protein